MNPRLYSTRSNARRAAQTACRKALKAPYYQAAEGPDYGIHPRWTTDDILAGHSERFYFELRGPAAEALKDEGKQQ